ncbi:hypothetical protein KIMH_12750 [Bombiscardovia apis]|uniref:Bacteriocin, lactococcin 972 family n=1 Tax=Bombiscardovia apis TaxID=2932182 RepID=A0ABN6SHD2_9BIFI|nr:hypothetical protein KIMH_12750 [Bombiscardovia apis]
MLAKRKGLNAVLAVFVSVILSLGVGATPANADSGGVNNPRVTGTWYYNWSYSYASAQGRGSYLAHAMARQDGWRVTRTAKYPNQIVTQAVNGNPRNHNDGALAY